MPIMDSTGSLLRLLNFRPNSLRAPNSWVGHLPFAYWIIQELKPSVFVELGTHTGNSYFSFCQSIKDNQTPTKAFAVDTWEGDAHAGFYDETVFSEVQQENEVYKSFSTLLRTTFDSAANYFEDKSIDLLHIDGLHTYEAVKHDFETWLPKMSDSGVILFHDTNVHRDDFGVYRFWDEISKDYLSIEFFHSHGLGIIQISDNANFQIPRDSEHRKTMREFFAGLSDHMLTYFDRDAIAADRDAIAADRDLLTQTKTFRWTMPARNLVSRLRRTT